ncbi:zinc finger Ran-binding domain-containing protein [Amycolatopsis sp. NPDC051071]|uniref:zinc finger Ran-binding domain-containing protein n=1 Tax=Amycolatopsis sp. NPDC051071 TaxID=3154637 RepID=UPI003414DD46
MKNKADWSCDSCHTNNYAQQTSCRVCLREPGSATAVVVLSAHKPLKVPHDETVDFVESRHKELPRPTITLAPVPPSRPAPAKPSDVPKRPAPAIPRPVPAAPRPPVSGSTVWRVVRFLLIPVLAIVVITNLGRIGELLGSLGTNGAGRITTPCPVEAARWLPGNGRDAELVARYDTGRHTVTICLDSAGSYHYDGQLKGKPTTKDNHISLPAVRTATGFTAVNGEYRYEISGQDLTVSKKGKIETRLRLVPLPS